MKSGQAKGLQIAFLMFAVMLMAVPISELIVRNAGLAGAPKAFVDRGTHFALAFGLIVLVPPLRRFATNALAAPIPPAMRVEVALATLGKLALAFASAAALALWFYLTEGQPRVERMASNVDRDFAFAFSDAGLVRLILAVLLAPIIEELVFRGFIYQAFERRWGWFWAMLATSALFGFYHPHFWSAFTASVILVCVMRRTGSIRAPIVVHAIYNLMLWWPLLGRHVFPSGPEMTELSTWYVHGTCLIAVVVALPVYVWMSRDRNIDAPTLVLEPNAPLPK